MFISREARLAYNKLAEARDEHGDPVCAQTDPDEWFPDAGGSANKVKAMCNDCPLINECLEFAIQNGEQWGIWGGETYRKRRKIMQARGIRPYHQISIYHDK